MADPTCVTDASTLNLLINKVLDWPFLLFILVLVLARKSGRSILGLIASRKLEVEIAGSRLSIGEAIEAVEEDATRNLSELSERISALEADSRADRPPAQDHGAAGVVRDSVPSTSIEAPLTDDVAAKRTEDQIFQRMLAALANSRFTWRTIERLAISAGVSEKEAHAILAAHQGHEVALSRGKSGKIIARLVDR